MSTAYDLEGFTSSTLRSKGCGAGVGVEEVCRALVTVTEGFCLCTLPSLQMWIIEIWAQICERQEKSAIGPSQPLNIWKRDVCERGDGA
jgi:hypothetical protein